MTREAVDAREEKHVMGQPDPQNDLKDLAEKEMAEKRSEMGDEGQARELYDVTGESAQDLVKQQDDESTPRAG